jgi:hypothetical protein
MRERSVPRTIPIVESGITRGDIAVSGIVAIAGVQEVWFGVAGLSASSGSPSALTAAYILIAAILLRRRREPLAVVVVVNAILAALFVAFGSSNGLATLLPVVLASYALGAYGNATEFWPGVFVTAAGIAVHELRDPHFVLAGPTPLAWAVIVGTAFLGRLLTSRARRVHDAEERGRRLEDEQEQAMRQASETG